MKKPEFVPSIARGSPGGDISSSDRFSEPAGGAGRSGSFLLGNEVLVGREGFSAGNFGNFWKSLEDLDFEGGRGPSGPESVPLLDLLLRDLLLRDLLLCVSHIGAASLVGVFETPEDR